MCWIVIANEQLTLGYFLCFDVTNFPPFLIENTTFSFLFGPGLVLWFVVTGRG